MERYRDLAPVEIELHGDDASLSLDTPDDSHVELRDDPRLFDAERGKNGDDELGFSESTEDLLYQAVAGEDLPLVEGGINAAGPKGLSERLDEASLVLARV